MGIFDEEEIEGISSWQENVEEIEIFENNKYLSNSENALKLIGKIIGISETYDSKYIQLKEIERFIKKDFLEVLKNIPIRNKAQLQVKLFKLIKKLYDEQEYQFLKDKTIIGIGGKFSSGKSRFINNLLNIKDTLPENQNPTTSIPTYLIKNKNKNIDIFTKDNKKISIDIETVQALTHEFFEKYKIGFSSFIKSIIMSESELPYSNFAFLDTPGYSKAEENMITKESETDKQKAFEQLKKVHYLIWLIDIENGDISNTDIKFIKSLKLSNKILIIVNKADKKTEEEIKKIIIKIKSTIKNEKLNIYDVLPFSSNDEKIKQENFFKIQQFFDFVRNQKIESDSVMNQMSKIQKSIENDFENQLKEKEEERNRLNDVIFKSNDIFEIRSLVVIYSEILEKIRELRKYKKRFNRKSQELESKMEKYYKRSS